MVMLSSIVGLMNRSFIADFAVKLPITRAAQEVTPAPGAKLLVETSLMGETAAKKVSRGGGKIESEPHRLTTSLESYYPTAQAELTLLQVEG